MGVLVEHQVDGTAYVTVGTPEGVRVYFVALDMIPVLVDEVRV